MSRFTLPFAAQIAAAAVALAAFASPAFAKAPQGLQTLEEIRQKAEQAEADARRREIEAQKDPNREAIENYSTKKSDLGEWRRLVDIVNDAKTPELQDYRPLAAQALIRRFEQEDVEKDPVVRQVRIDIAIELVELLGAPSKDEKGIMAANQIFYAWYRAQLVNTKPIWKPEAKQSERQKAMKKMREFLKKSDKD